MASRRVEAFLTAALRPWWLVLHCATSTSCRRPCPVVVPRTIGGRDHGRARRPGSAEDCAESRLRLPASRSRASSSPRPLLLLPQKPNPLEQISFTFILPLFPKLLEFYRAVEAASPNSDTLLSRIPHSLNAYKNAFARPIDSRYDIVLLGGALGSLFSALQAIASPVIGMLSDRYGRRKTLLISMCGNIASVLLWLLATDFRTFLASRIVGGLSEGNIQIATAIATDISDEKQRGATMALIGACFCVSICTYNVYESLVEEFGRTCPRRNEN